MPAVADTIQRPRIYSANFKRWAEYFAGTHGATFDPVGLEQFFLFESAGIVPPIPNSYFLRLSGGRSMFNALTKEVRDSYGTSEWQGYAADQSNMPDWLFRAFYGWHPICKTNK